MLQTTDRQTDGRATANSERERDFTFAKKSSRCAAPGGKTKEPLSVEQTTHHRRDSRSGGQIVPDDHTAGCEAIYSCR